MDERALGLNAEQEAQELELTEDFRANKKGKERNKINIILIGLKLSS